MISALLECDAFPAGMELFPAADDDAWTLIQRVIDESDYYLLVIGGKYGSVDPATEVSYTEKEYDYAVEAGKPVMAFLHGAPDDLVVSKAELDAELRSKLNVFRKKVEGTKHVKYWTTAEGLAGTVALSFNRFVRQYPSVGWIRSDLGTDTESLRELERTRRRVAELESQLAEARTTPPPGSKDLQQGDETHELDVSATATWKGDDPYSKTTEMWLTAEVSWNDILMCLGPRLLQEAEEQALRKALTEWVKTYHWNTLVRKARDELEASQEDFELLTRFGFIITTDDFGTVIVQLVALGLIEKSNKKRSVSDTGTYWKLTPYGETRTIQLRALRRETASQEQEAIDLDGLEDVELAMDEDDSEA